MCKKYCAQVQNRIVDACVQVWGGAGYLEETGIPRAFRDARLQRIGGGTDEIMNEVIAKRTRARRVSGGAADLQNRGAVHLAERVADQFEPLTVGPVEVERRAAHHLALHARGLELALEMLPALGLDRDREVMHPAEHLRVVAEIEPGKSKNASRLPFPMSKKKCVEPW